MEKESGYIACLCPVCGDWTFSYLHCERCEYVTSGRGFENLDFEDMDHNFTLRDYRRWYKDGTLQENLTKVQPQWQYAIDKGLIPSTPGTLVDLPLVYPDYYENRFDE